MLSLVFFFNDTATTEIYTLSLHDALPIWSRSIAYPPWSSRDNAGSRRYSARSYSNRIVDSGRPDRRLPALSRDDHRSEEHTSELQSHLNLVCRLLLVKKKNSPSHQATPHA